MCSGDLNIDHLNNKLFEVWIDAKFYFEVELLCSGDLNTDHLNTKLFEVWISNGSVTQNITLS